MGQLVLGTASDRTTIHAAAYGARANLAGVLRRDDVSAGRVGFYDSYDDPSAQAQSAFTSRLQLAVNHVRAAESGARLQLGAWLLSSDLTLRENFTGYLQRSIQMPDWVGRGDLIEQRNRGFALGGSASYEAAPWLVSDALQAKVETGLTFRLDTIEQAQRLLQPPQNETWDERIDAGISGADIGAFVDLSFRFWSWLILRGGGRADVLYYDIEDRLGNFIPRFRREMYIVGFRRTALGVALGPRATLEAKVSPNVSLLLSAGRGYRSPQARQLEEGETAPYAIVDSFELGTKLALARDRLTLSAAAYRTHLSLDLAFDPSEGRLERIGPTTRQGLALQVRATPASWLIANASLTWVHATLDAPPPPTAADPNPPYRRGQALPYVPPFVARADLGARHALFTLGQHALEGRAGLGLTVLGERPLPYSEFASSFAVVDVTLHVRWHVFDFGVDATNLFDTEYAASEYSFVSDWRATATPSLLPARHFAAGPPRMVMFNLGLTL
jgi:outer membrane receptor protein involved in Fe transport